MGTNTVPFWPRHKRPDLERDKYGPLPNPDPWAGTKAKFKRDPKREANV